jgi:autotransporter-associated beta strand protein
MWLSNGTRSTWITFDLGAVQTLSGFHLWNYNEAAGGGLMKRGVRTAGIYSGITMPTNGTPYAASGSLWGTLVTNMTFTMASGTAADAGRYYSFANTVTTRYLQIYVTDNFPTSDAYTGLSEIRFFAATARRAGDRCISPSAATARGYYPNRTPARAIDGSGMTPSTPLLATSTAGNTPTEMWLDNDTDKTWITFDVGTIQPVTGIRLWNYNENGATKNGVKIASVYVGNSLPTNGTPYSQAGAAWGSWVQDFRFGQADGSAALGGADYPFVDPVMGRYIQLYISEGLGNGKAGLSEIMFYTETRYEAISPSAATAESFYASGGGDIRSPDRAINGSDMTPNNPLTIASTAGNGYVSAGWLSSNRTNTWITFDLGAEQTVAGFRLWNYNEVNLSGRGVKSADIYIGTSLPTNGTPYAESGAAWGTLVTNMTFDVGNGLPGLAGRDYSFANTVTTRYVQIYVTDNWSATELYTGIGEIMFYTTMTDLTRRNSGLQVIPNSARESFRIVEGTGTVGALSLEAATTTNNSLYVDSTEATTTIDPAGQTLAVSKLQMQQDAGGLTIGTGSNNGTLTSAGKWLLVDNASMNPVTVHSVIADGGAASGLTKSGAGPLILTAANTYSGSTTVNGGKLQLAAGSISNPTISLNSGTLQLDSGTVAHVGQALLNTAMESTLRFDSGTLSVHAGQPALAAADWIGAGNAVRIADGGAIFNTASGNATINRPLLQEGASTGGVTKAGANTLTLTAPSTYAGRTVVQGGTLKLTPPAPIIYYDFDTASISGSTTLLNRGSGGAAFNGVINGAPTTGAPGKTGEAFVFSATGQGVATANSVSLANGFSYAAWVKSSGSTNVSQRIINNYYAAGGYLGTTGDNKFQMYIKSIACPPTQASDDISDWHHVALTWDGQKGILFYDGVGIQTNTFTGVNAAYNSKIGFGNNSVPNTEFWNGAMDEAYVFDRALTAVEMAGLKALSWANVKQLPVATSLELNNNAILELSGISQTVTTLTLNGGLTRRGDCTWGAPGSGATYTSPQFTGTGVLRVLGPPSRGTMIRIF